MNSPPSPSPSTPSSGDASPAQMPIDMAAAVPAAPVAPSPNTAKRRLPSSGVPYGSASRRRREESLKEEKEREGERGLADVELMKWLNSRPESNGVDDDMSKHERRRSSVLGALRRRKEDDEERRRPPALDFCQAARDEAAAKLCGLALASPLTSLASPLASSSPPLTSLPLPPVFPCAQSALAAHVQLSGPLLKHQTPTGLARLVGKAWKPRHGVFCTYSYDAARTVACLHVFATPTPDALELARLIVTEDSVVFVVEPSLAHDDIRRGPRDMDSRKWVFQVQGISGTQQPLGANVGLDDDRLHAVWFFQCPDADARQRWVSSIKRAVLLQRAERAGFGGTLHFASPRSVTDLPSGDLDVVLAMRARASTAPYASPPITPMTASFAPVTPASTSFATTPSTFSAFTPASPLSTGSEHSHHIDAISLAFTRSQTPTYAPSVHTTHTAPALTSKSRSRSSTVTNSAPVQALRGFFSGSRPPSRSASVALTKESKDVRGKRVRTSSSSATGLGAPQGYLNMLAMKDEDVSESAQPTHPYQSLAHPLGTPISAVLGSMDLSADRDNASATGLAPPGIPSSTLPGLGPSGLPTPGLSALSILHAPSPRSVSSAAVGKGLGTSLPPPPRARRAGSVSHVLPGLPNALGQGHSKDDGITRVREEAIHGEILGTLRGHPDEEHGVRRPSLVPMLSLSFGRGDMDAREKDQEPKASSPPSRVLPPMLAPPSSPLPIPPGIPVAGRIPGASRSSLALPTTGSSLGVLLPAPLGSSPALPGAWPSPSIPSSDGPNSAVTSSDVYQTALSSSDAPSSAISSNGAPYSISSRALRSTPSYSMPALSDALGPYSTDDAGASYLNLTDEPYPSPMDHTSSSHFDLSESTPQPNSTPFTSEAPTASNSSQASIHSDHTTSTRPGGRDLFRGSDPFRSSVSETAFRRTSLQLRSRTSLDDAHVGPAAVSGTLSALKGALHEYPEGDGWDGEGMGVGYQYAHSGSGRECSQSGYTQSISVRESPARTTTTGSFRASSPTGFMRRFEVDDSPVGTSPSSSRVEGDLRAYVPRDSFGSAFRSGRLASEDGTIQFTHPFSSASQSPSSSGKRAHRRAGSYAGPSRTLFTITSSPLERVSSVDRGPSTPERGASLERSFTALERGAATPGRFKAEKLPPAAPPPSMPLPPTPLASRPGTPVSRPRTPSRPGTAPQLASIPPPPRHTSLRTRLRMLSTPSTPEPAPPRELGPPTEDDLAQPISRVPIQLLVREDSAIRRNMNEYAKETFGGNPMGTSLPPPPRIRTTRQHSYCASDREGTSEGRRSDESGKRGFGEARDSGVDLEQ